MAGITLLSPRLQFRCVLGGGIGSVFQDNQTPLYPFYALLWNLGCESFWRNMALFITGRTRYRQQPHDASRFWAKHNWDHMQARPRVAPPRARRIRVVMPRRIPSWCRQPPQLFSSLCLRFIFELQTILWKCPSICLFLGIELRKAYPRDIF